MARRHETDAIHVGWPPFRHWAADAATAAAGAEGWREVGRSHWTGGLDEGRFEPDGGRVTDELARLILKLVTRMARKSNWRNYSWCDDMVAAAALHLMTGALKFDCTKSSNAFAYLTTVSHNVFIRYVQAERKLACTRDELLIMAGASPSFRRQTEDAMAARAAAEEG